MSAGHNLGGAAFQRENNAWSKAEAGAVTAGVAGPA